MIGYYTANEVLTAIYESEDFLKYCEEISKYASKGIDESYGATDPTEHRIMYEYSMVLDEIVGIMLEVSASILDSDQSLTNYESLTQTSSMLTDLISLMKDAAKLYLLATGEELDIPNFYKDIKSIIDRLVAKYEERLTIKGLVDGYGFELDMYEEEYM